MNDVPTPTISIVCPCYNEQDVIGQFFSAIVEVLNKTGETYEIICVNDGSKDKTLPRLRELKLKYPGTRVIDLSRNFGKEAALTAGIDQAQGEVIIPIDADLQDPPELIHDFLTHWRQGYDVVVAKRVDRSTDTATKRLSAQLFYKIHNMISKVNIPDNVGDFRLITRRVADALQQLPENQRFMKGIFSWVGFSTKEVEYIRESRVAGKTSFNGWQLWNFALDGITGFSTAPLRVWLYLGLLISVMSFFYGSVIVAKTLLFGIDTPGFASIITATLFLGGIQLIGIGVLGEYIGRLYIEAKRRPIYLIDREY